MKKGLLVGALVGVLLLTGCGSKRSKLVCTTKQTESGMEMVSTATTYFDSKGYATKVDIKMVIDAGSESLAKTALNALKSNYDDIKQNGSKLTVKQTIKPGKDEKNTIKDAEKEFKSQGYTCK